MITLSSSMRPGAEKEVFHALRLHEGLAQRVQSIRLERTTWERRQDCLFTRILDLQAKIPCFTSLRSLNVSANLVYEPGVDYHSLPIVDAPQLAHLRFEDFFMRWTSSVLVDLDITGAAGRLQIPVLLISDLLRVNASTLRTLRLHRCLNTSEQLADDALKGTDPVFLPGLSEFHFGSDVDMSVTFLSRAINMPRSTYCTVISTRMMSTLAPSLPLLRFAWDRFVESSGDIAISISDPCRDGPHQFTQNLEECLIEFYESINLMDQDVSPLAGRRPKLIFQCSAASGIAQLEHILDFMDGYRITMLTLLCDSQFPIETKAIMRSLPNVRFCHFNNFRVGDRTAGALSLLCASPEYLPSLETLSLVFDLTWRLSWADVARSLTQRPLIRTVIVHDRFALPMDDREFNKLCVVEIIRRARDDLEVRWVFDHGIQVSRGDVLV
ncbi:unnamed protein product [Peniophora sp. CBMAI 1063]|nr:unnamed protein product [Peniophora sp. CBMAI 1063]